MPRRESGPDVNDDLISAAFYAQVEQPAAMEDPVQHVRSVARFVQALARAIQAFHTYPPDSPARSDVVELVRAALRECGLHDGHDALQLHVTNEGLRYKGEILPTDAGAMRAMLLTLRRGYVAILEIESSTSTRDLRQFCTLLAFPDGFLNRAEDLPEILEEKGVTGIRTPVIAMHQTIEGGTVPPPLLELVHCRREGGQLLETRAEGGWIRVDPSVPLDGVALEDLPLLLHDASSLAVALQQMGGRRKEQISPTRALVAHYTEITELYADAAPEIVDTLFQRLAGIVKDLPGEIKHELLREQVLPGLLDGSRSGRILRHFSDDEVSSALWLLLDIGVGGVEMLSAGLANLELPDDRLAGVVDRVTEQLRLDRIPGTGAGVSLAESGRADHLLGAGTDAAGEFLAFRAFDLSVDQEATAALAVLVNEVEQSDGVADLLRCYADVLSLSADTKVVTSIMRRSRGLFLDLENRGQPSTLAFWLALYARVGRLREQSDAEVAALINGTLAAYVTPEFIHRVSALEMEADGPLVTIICELGATGVAALVESLAVESDRSARNRLLLALTPRAAELADELVAYLSHPQWYVVRNVLMLLGHGGSGHEKMIARCVDHDDARVVREAFFALSRIGSERGAEYTALALRHSSPLVRRHAAEALWRYDSEVSNALVLSALDDRAILADDPELLKQLAETAGRRRVPGLEERLRRLRWNLLAVWHGGRRSLGWCALKQLRRSE